MMQKDERRPKGHVLKPGFTSKLYKELLEGLREQKSLVNYLNKGLGIGWRNLSLNQLRDVPLSILMRIIVNYSYLWDREKFVAAGATLAARIYDYADRFLDEFNDPNVEDPDEDSDLIYFD